MLRHLTRFFCGFSLLLTTCCLVFGGVYTELASPQRAFQIRQLQRSSRALDMTVEFPAPAMADVEDYPGLMRFDFPHANLVEREGLPVVPVTGGLFRIPWQSGMVVEVLEADYETVTGVSVPVYTGEATHTNRPRYQPCPDPADEWFPPQPVQVSEPMILRDFRVAGLTIYPVQVNTARREARVVRNIRYRIRFEGDDPQNTPAHPPRTLSPNYLPVYRALLDWDDSELDEYELALGDVIVVTQNDETLLDSMATWFEWKRDLGYSITFLTDDDVVEWNAGSIRNGLLDLYETAAPPPEAIVILGDVGGDYNVPVSTSSPETDCLYECLAGGDDLPDVMSGRISVESIYHGLVYANKVRAYERDLDLEEADWLERGLLLANSPSESPGIESISNNISALMNERGYATIYRYYHVGTDSAIWALENGVGYALSMAYLNSSFRDVDVAGLLNDHMTPIVADISDYQARCGMGLQPSEILIRAGTTVTPRGAVAVVGQSSCMHGHRAMVMSEGFSEALLRHNAPTIGSAYLYAKINAFYQYPNAGNSNYYGNNLQIVGDPLIQPWVGRPDSLLVEADTVISEGRREYTVTVTKPGGLPLEGARVCARNSSQRVLAMTNSAGEAALLLPRFNGDSFTLTVAAYGHTPFQDEIPITNDDESVGIYSYQLYDDGSFGSSGNDDGVPQPGETVALRVQTWNTGPSTQHNLAVSATADDPYLDVLEGDVEYGDLVANGMTWGENAITLEVAGGAPHRWIGVVQLTFSSDEGEWEETAHLTLEAPAFQVTAVTGQEEAEPGDLMEFDVQVVNNGTVTMPPGTANLYSLNGLLAIQQGNCAFDAVEAGEVIQLHDFSALLHEHYIPQAPLQALLVLEADNGPVDTTLFSFHAGSAGASDPTGPDAYGYVAFENLDVGYDQHPDYDWVELHPSQNPDIPSEVLDLADLDANEDNAIVIDLPFTVQYYGQEFDEITIAVNGWAAFGSQQGRVNRYNRRLVGPGGPDNLLAPLWHDRRCSEGAIVVAHDLDQDRFIIEWHEVGDRQNNHPCTFQIQIFEQTEEHGAYTGDNEIAFLYHTLDLVDVSSNRDVGLPSVGIRNGDHTQGLELYYNDVLPATAHTLAAGRAVLFTVIPQNTGYIAGRVTDGSSGEPIAGAELDHVTHATVTDSTGHYCVGPVPFGLQTLTVSAACYSDLTDQEVVLAQTDTVIADFQLNRPELTLSTTTLIDTLDEGEETVYTVLLANPGGGELTWNLELNVPDDIFQLSKRTGITQQTSGELDEPWDRLATFPLDEQENKHRGVVYDGSSFWISGGDNYDTQGPNRIYRYSVTGELQQVYDQPVPPNQRSVMGMGDLIWDGIHLWGADNGVLYQMSIGDDELGVVNYFEIPSNPARYLAYDAGSELFWMGDAGTTVRAVNREGEIVHEYGVPYSPRGAAWMPQDPDGYHLYMICRHSEGEPAHFIKLEPENGDVSVMRILPPESLAGFPMGGDLTAQWELNHWCFVTVMDTDDNDSLTLWEVRPHTDWLTVTHNNGALAPHDSTLLMFQMRNDQLAPGRYALNATLHSNACDVPDSVVRIELFAPGLGLGPDRGAQPLAWRFDGVWPNPFNPTAVASFTLKEAGPVRAVLYNTLGQETAILVDAPLAAGQHELRIDGSLLASGVYFLRLDAGPLKTTRRVVLLK